MSSSSRTGWSISWRQTTSLTRARLGLVLRTSLTFTNMCSVSVAVRGPWMNVFLDFRKAFDKVPHKRLMKKVRALGIQGNVAAWIENWLAGRRQRVIINGVPSYFTAWGPSLVIYINDLDLGLSSKVSKFAEDTKLGINAANLESVRALQRDLAAIGEWSTVWQIPFNLDKCHVLHVGTANQGENYSLLGSAISTVDQETDLGVVITATSRALRNV